MTGGLGRCTVLACALVLAGCGAVATPTTAPTSAPISTGAPEEIRLPGPNQQIPDGVAGATAWVEINSDPGEFDRGAFHATPADLADAFGAALHASLVSPERPDLELEYLEETAERGVLVVSETGRGDDSVAGSQYTLVLVREPNGWYLDELWIRALCRRAVFEDLCV